MKRYLSRLSFLMAPVLLVSSIAGCVTVDESYRRASATNSVPAYQEFLKNYPNSKYSSQAKERVNALNEAKAFAEAERKNTVTAYKEFASNYPAGKWAEEARKRAAATDEDAFVRAFSMRSKEAFQGFVESYPSSGYTPEVKEYMTWRDRTRIGLVLECNDNGDFSNLKKAIEKAEPRILVIKGENEAEENELSALVRVRYTKTETNPHRVLKGFLGLLLDVVVAAGTTTRVSNNVVMYQRSNFMNTLAGSANQVNESFYSEASSCCAVKEKQCKKTFYLKDFHGLAAEVLPVEMATWLAKEGPLREGFINTAMKKGDNDLRLNVVGLLCAVKSPQADAILAAALKDSTPEIWKKAFERLGDSYAYDLLAISLTREYDIIRIETAFEHGAANDPRTFDLLFTALKGTDARVRGNAAAAMGYLKDDRVIEPLVEALKDEYSSVRNAAVMALGKIKNTRVVKPLIAALKDEDFGVRETAAAALSEIKDIRAVESLIAMLGSENNHALRRNAADALGEIGDRRAVEPLIEVLGCEDLDVKKSVIKALEEIKDARAVVPLIGQLDNNRLGIKSDVSKALTYITGKTFGYNKSAWQSWWDENKSGYAAELAYVPESPAASVPPVQPTESAAPTVPKPAPQEDSALAMAVESEPAPTPQQLAPPSSVPTPAKVSPSSALPSPQASKEEVYITSEPPSADIYINGNYMATTPADISLDAGDYTVVIIKEGYKAESASLSVNGDINQPLSVRLNPR